jgi:hypothetical protein
VTDRDTRTTERAETRRPLLEDFQLLNDGIDRLLTRLTTQPQPTAA